MKDIARSPRIPGDFSESAAERNLDIISKIVRETRTAHENFCALIINGYFLILGCKASLIKYSRTFNSKFASVESDSCFLRDEKSSRLNDVSAVRDLANTPQCWISQSRSRGRSSTHPLS